MLKPILHWLIIVTLFANQFAFAGPVFSRPVATSSSVTASAEEPTSCRLKLYATCGKVRSALAAVGRFFHNHSDFICRTSILALDSIYFFGTFFPEAVSPNVVNTSFMLLNYVALIGMPFAVRETAKALGDTKYACKRKCKEMIFIGSVRTASNTLSTLTIPLYSVAATLLEFERTYDSGMAIYNYTKPLGFVFLILNPSLDIYNFFLGKRVIRELDNDTSPVRMRNQIALLRGEDVENVRPLDVRLSALVRSQIDLVTWKKFLETTRPEEQVPLLSGRVVHLDDEEQIQIFAAIMSNIRTNKNYAVGDLTLNLLSDVEMGVIRVSGPGKIMACLDLGSAVMFDTILGIKKCRQARQRARLEAASTCVIKLCDPEIGAIERLESRRDQHCLNIETVDFPNPDFVIEVVPTHELVTDKYAFMLADNPDIPIEVRKAAAHSCNPMDSRDLVYKPTIPFEVREAAAHHCSPEVSYGIVIDEGCHVRIRTAAAHHCSSANSYDIAINGGLDIHIRAAAAKNCEEEACGSLVYNTGIPIEVRRAAAKTSELRIFLEHSEDRESIVEERSIVPYNDDHAEERQPLLPDRVVLSSQTDDRLVSLSRAELFRIASDPNEPLDVRCGAAYLLR